VDDEGRQVIRIPEWWSTRPRESKKLPPYKKPPERKSNPRFDVAIPDNGIPRFVSRRIDWMQTLHRRG